MPHWDGNSSPGACSSHCCLSLAAQLPPTAHLFQHCSYHEGTNTSVLASTGWKCHLPLHSCHCSEWSFLPQRMSCQVQEGAAPAQDHSYYRRSFLDSQNSTSSLFFSQNRVRSFNTFPLPAWISNEWQDEHSPHSSDRNNYFAPWVSERMTSHLCLPV